jgi:hypothetical protein
MPLFLDLSVRSRMLDALGAQFGVLNLVDD